MGNTANDLKAKVETPLGLVIPAGVYAILIAFVITAGSALIMFDLDIPIWGWGIEFAVLSISCLGFVPKMMEKWEKRKDDAGRDVYVIGVSKKTFVISSAIIAILFVAAAVLAIL